MEEKKKVWIRGRKGRESEIKGILTGLGAGDAAEVICADGDCIYFINHDNEIDCVPGFSTELAQIIMDNYKEIKFPGQEWKDGDILVRADRNGKEFVVFERFDEDDFFFYHYPLFKGDGVGPLLVVNYRKALNEEVLMFKELLASKGKEWDEEMKRVVKKVYEPLRGETYYYIHSSGAVCSEHWRAEPFQLDTRRFGNCFKTREEAVSAARKIRALLLDADDEGREK